MELPVQRSKRDTRKYIFQSTCCSALDQYVTKSCQCYSHRSRDVSTTILYKMGIKGVSYQAHQRKIQTVNGDGDVDHGGPHGYRQTIRNTAY